MNKVTLSQERGRARRVLSLALAALLALALVLPLNMQAAYADPSSAEAQAQADEVSARLALAEEELTQIGIDYQAAVVAHEDALAAMNEAQARIDEAEIIISETQGRLGEIATQQYRQGPFSFLDVLFGASSFSEFLSSWEYINFANQQNAELIQASKDARAEAEAAHEEFAVQEQAAAQCEAEQAELMARAEEKVAAQEAEYADLSAEVAALVEKEQASRVEERVAESPVDYGPAPEVPEGGYGGVVAAAQSQLGAPYISGGTGNPGFDCSGFTQWCYLNGAGINIGRDTFSQYNNASYRAPYTSGEAVPGDVLWWPPSTGYTHVAIYVGGGQFIHSPSPGHYVEYASFQIDQLIILRF